jgi:hypothetical protein
VDERLMNAEAAETGQHLVPKPPLAGEPGGAMLAASHRPGKMAIPA